MPRKLSKFHELSDRSKRRRADEAGCSHFSYSASSSDVEITAVSPSPDINVQILPFISNDQININSDPSHNDDQDHFENINNDFISSSYSSCSSSDKSIDESIHESYFQTGHDESESPTGIKHFLKNWAIKHNVTEVCLSDLLVGLKSNVDGLSKLPSDARTLLKTNIVFEKSIVEPGSYIHFGLEMQLRRLISNSPSANNIQDLKLLLNIDGLPLFKSSAGQVYPILIVIMNVPQLKNVVFPVGIYYGMRKPNNMFDFLNPFINELVDLMTNGLIIELGNKISVKLIGMCCDAPAKKDLLGIKGHGGYNSCTKCTVHGRTIERRRTFADLDCPLRTNYDFINWVDVNFRQLDTPLVRIPDFDFVKSIILDFMHLVCLGVMRTMLLIWCNGELPHKLSRQLIERVSDFMKNNRRNLPVEFVRQPRELKYLLRFKATEYRSFLLYLGPVALKGVLSDDKYINFLTLHVAISILLNPKSCLKPDLTEYARKLLRHFVQNFNNLYGEMFITHNFHGLIHLTDDVEYFGTILDSITLDTISAFPFENYLQTIKKMIKGNNKPLEQIGKRLGQIFSIHLPFSSTADKSNFPKFKNAHSNGPLPVHCSGLQYSTVIFSNFTIKILPPNNCCGTKKGDIIIVENICYSTELNCYVIVGRTFLNKNDFFKKPCKSSSLGIFEVQKQSVLKCWPITEIITKYVFFEYKQSYITFPLLHTA
ncbi:uncharacterized protein LOC111038505 [Myzus persicae]|uniref:uncharacterized protein LOC111038505 n=1 Tax=Myzus persicae TaxID=13164 RepID=UPI000B934D7D|nr:uncharacterized protein LOC111038505 [Myzus persicae]